MMQAGSTGNVTTLLQRQRRQSMQWHMQDFVKGEAVPFPRSSMDRRTKSITQEFFSKQLRRNRRRKNWDASTN